MNLQSGNFSTDEAYVLGTAALLPGTLRCKFARRSNLVRACLRFLLEVFSDSQDACVLRRPWWESWRLVGLAHRLVRFVSVFL